MCVCMDGWTGSIRCRCDCDLSVGFAAVHGQEDALHKMIKDYAREASAKNNFFPAQQHGMVMYLRPLWNQHRELHARVTCCFGGDASRGWRAQLATAAGKGQPQGYTAAACALRGPDKEGKGGLVLCCCRPPSRHFQLVTCRFLEHPGALKSSPL